jgi:two-component system, NtrC family, sensor histidine kinase PilS
MMTGATAGPDADRRLLRPGPAFGRFSPADPPLRLVCPVQIVWDLLFAVALVYITGGIDSPFAFLFILIIISASFFLRRREIFIVAAAAAILYGSLLDLQYYGYLPQIGGLIFPQQIDARQMFYAVFVNVLAFLLTAMLCAILAERMRRSEQALEKKSIDYEELESLNRTILANIASGLMIVNPAGRIRSFNAAAENMTGYNLVDVYDRDVRELFPAFAVYDGTLQIVERGEGFFDSREAGRRLLGYASSLVKGADGPDSRPAGYLQDLMTWFKEMEERLKRRTVWPPSVSSPPAWPTRSAILWPPSAVRCNCFWRGPSARKIDS